MNRSPALVALLFTAVAAASTACGASPRNARPAEVPIGAVRVVPASQVIGECHCDDEEEAQWLPEGEAAPQRSVEYVKLSDWTPPPQVLEVEAQVPPRGDAPLTITQFPKLTLDREIGSSRNLLAGGVGVYGRSNRGRRTHR
jgi:hypothetical protein